MKHFICAKEIQPLYPLATTTSMRMRNKAKIGVPNHGIEKHFERL